MEMDHMVGNYILRCIVLIVIGLRPCYDFGRGKQWGGILSRLFIYLMDRGFKIIQKGYYL